MHLYLISLKLVSDPDKDRVVADEEGSELRQRQSLGEGRIGVVVLDEVSCPGAQQVESAGDYGGRLVAGHRGQPRLVLPEVLQLPR